MGEPAVNINALSNLTSGKNLTHPAFCEDEGLTEVSWEALNQGKLIHREIGELSSGKTKAAKVSFILMGSMWLGPALITIQSNHKCIFSKLLQKHSDVFSCHKPHRLPYDETSEHFWTKGKSTDCLTIFPLEPISMPTTVFFKS